MFTTITITVPENVLPGAISGLLVLAMLIMYGRQGLPRILHGLAVAIAYLWFGLRISWVATKAIGFKQLFTLWGSAAAIVLSVSYVPHTEVRTFLEVAVAFIAFMINLIWTGLRTDSPNTYSATQHLYQGRRKVRDWYNEYTANSRYVKNRWA